MGMESQPAGAPAPATTDPDCVCQSVAREDVCAGTVIRHNADARDLTTGLAQERAPQVATDCTREQVERLVENDPSLVPAGPSALLVEPSVLDPEEVRALLVDLHALLAGA